jgi:hypothetical protein
MASAQAGDDWYLFGGHRRWQGFAPGNSAANAWRAATDAAPLGGVLDDLWRLRYVAGDEASAASPSAGGRGGFVQLAPRESCAALPPGADPAPAHDAQCAVVWPPGRQAVPARGTAIARHSQGLCALRHGASCCT